MAEFTKPDLATADEKELASLVVRGVVELGEIPVRNRRSVEREAANLRAELERKRAEAKKVEAVQHTEDSLKKMTVAALRTLAEDYPNLKLESKMKKPELVAALLSEISHES